MKILFLVNRTRLNHNIFDFIKSLHEKKPSKLNCLLLSSEEDGELERDRKLIEEQLKVVLSDQLPWHIQVIRENYIDTIVDETTFADLFICDDDLDLEYFSLNSLIASSNCAVLVVPDNGVFTSEVIVSYDGKISSIHAMKQFSYLFPWMRESRIYLVSVIPENILQMEYDALAREWMRLHFPKAEIVIRKGDVKEELVNFINQKPATVVMGAFGRSALSRLFRESLGPYILNNSKVPLFIAHS